MTKKKHLHWSWKSLALQIFRVWGLFCPFIVFFLLKLPLHTFPRRRSKQSFFLKPNIGSRASSEKINLTMQATVRERERERNKPRVRDTQRLRENGGRKQRDGVNLIWRETDSLVWWRRIWRLKPDLMASADEAYGAPNPGMRCAVALVSKKDLGM